MAVIGHIRLGAGVALTALNHVLSDAQDIARRLLEVLENYVTHPRARVDASERLARLIRVVKPISVKPVKCGPLLGLLFATRVAALLLVTVICFQLCQPRSVWPH